MGLTQHNCYKENQTVPNQTVPWADRQLLEVLAYDKVGEFEDNEW